MKKKYRKLYIKTSPINPSPREKTTVSILVYLLLAFFCNIQNCTVSFVSYITFLSLEHYFSKTSFKNFY